MRNGRDGDVDSRKYVWDNSHMDKKWVVENKK